MMSSVSSDAVLTFGVNMTSKSDPAGMQLAAQSCFDPTASILVFQKLGDYERKSSTASIPGFLRTHPITDKRVKSVQKELDSARQTFELSGCSRYRSEIAHLF